MIETCEHYYDSKLQNNNKYCIIFKLQAQCKKFHTLSAKVGQQGHKLLKNINTTWSLNVFCNKVKIVHKLETYFEVRTSLLGTPGATATARMNRRPGLRSSIPFSGL